jgi:hypothetical protein
MDKKRPAGWRKSSHSGNGGNCVETMITWQTSAR